MSPSQLQLTTAYVDWTICLASHTHSLDLLQNISLATSPTQNVKGRASPYVHLRQPKTLYLNPNLTLAPQSEPKPNPKPYPNLNHIA